jgi:acetyltransferase-like isoleucine patch superfamily enzyme
MNQFRTFFKPSILDLLNTFYYRILGVKIGSKSYIMYPSKIIRFPKNVSIGKNTIIKPNVEICACNENSKISIGDFVSVGHYTFIYSSKKISIGNRVMVAPFCYLVDSNHDVSIAKGGLNGLNLVEEIKINDDVWIGQNSTLIPGALMLNGSILGAKSLLNKKVNEYEIFAGIPAKLIKSRK